MPSPAVYFLFAGISRQLLFRGLGWFPIIMNAALSGSTRSLDFLLLFDQTKSKTIR
jgi:hypothetical protein